MAGLCLVRLPIIRLARQAAAHFVLVRRQCEGILDCQSRSRQSKCTGEFTSFRRFPTEAVIKYNLACYDCQLGEIESGKNYLEKAFQIARAISALVRAVKDRLGLSNDVGWKSRSN